MKNKIFVTGLCTLHWGRLQYGNVGNYYIVEPFFRQIHKFFPECEILTTFQMDDTFTAKEKITVLPMSLYYSWSDCDVSQAERDYNIASSISNGDILTDSSEYIDILKTVDMVINISGDMWGDNAEHVGHDRFYVDCLKMRVAQLLGIKTILYAVTPGPFDNCRNLELVHDVFDNFSHVFIREEVSFSMLSKYGLSTKHVDYAPCPSYLFEPNKANDNVWIDAVASKKATGKMIVGLTFGGFNLPQGPYDMWPREKEQYSEFEKLVAHLLKNQEMDIVLFSHTNGFILPPNFKLINGRDFIILEDFYKHLIEDYPQYSDRIILVNEPLLPSRLKQLIGSFDMLITGRVHASVASTSQCIPTVFVEYDQRVIYSKKMEGFSRQLGLESYVSKPNTAEEMIKTVELCIKNLYSIRTQLNSRIDSIRNRIDWSYIQMRKIFDE